MDFKETCLGNWPGIFFMFWFTEVSPGFTDTAAVVTQRRVILCHWLGPDLFSHVLQ